MVDMTPTLGDTIRGLRMGYAWLDRCGCYVRLSRTEKENVFCCEVHPEGLISTRAKTNWYHICWWSDGEGNPGINLDEIDALKHIRRVKRQFTFYFDDNGKTK